MENLHVIVTGTSKAKGIGIEIAKIFASHKNAIVVGISRSKFSDEKVHSIVGDLSSPNGVKKAFQEAMQILNNKLDVLVLNHASYESHGWYINLNSTQQPDLFSKNSDIDEIFKTNALSHFWLFNLAFPYLEKSNGGRISVISSLAGSIGMPKMTLYGTTKHALEGFFKGISTESKLKNQINPYKNNAPPSITIHTIGSIDTDSARESTIERMKLNPSGLLESRWRSAAECASEVVAATMYRFPYHAFPPLDVSFLQFSSNYLPIIMDYTWKLVHHT